MNRENVAIIGVAESDYGRLPHLSALQQIAQATSRALADAGLTLQDIDGVASAGMPIYPSLQVSEYLGIQPTWSDSTSIGGASFEAHVAHAIAAIRAGYCRCVLVCYGSSQWSDGSRKLAGAGVDQRMPAAQYERPYGMLTPINGYSLAAQRHMHQYGTTSEQLAEIAVATRAWAAFNPLAMYREPIGIDDVLSSKLVADPLHLLDCCLVTDGGGALIVASEEVARDAAKKPVWVLGAAESTSHVSISQMSDLTVTPAATTGPRAMRQAGITPSDVDVAEIYDSFTITVLMTLEDLGFCEKGSGGPFVADGRLRPGGSFPTNTWGGGLSATHPGMLGIFLLLEGVRQLRGDFAGTPRQVSDARIALCHGTGGMLSSGSTVVLGVQ
ncbi:MAG TPA: acetyl-CoA acetyltransferase [Nitrolancea sp.]